MWGDGFSDNFSAGPVGFSGGGLEGFANDGYGAPAGWSGGFSDFASQGGNFSDTRSGDAFSDGWGYNVTGAVSPSGQYTLDGGNLYANELGPSRGSEALATAAQPRSRARAAIAGHSAAGRPYSPDASWIERNIGAVLGGGLGLIAAGPMGLIGGARAGDWLQEKIRGAGLEDPEEAGPRYAPPGGAAPGGDMFTDFWSRLAENAGGGEVSYAPPDNPQTGGESTGMPQPSAGLDDGSPPGADVTPPSAPGTPIPPPPDPFAAPRLIYGPYFNNATGQFDAPGDTPFDELVARYGVTRGRA